MNAQKKEILVDKPERIEIEKRRGELPDWLDNQIPEVESLEELRIQTRKVLESRGYDLSDVPSDESPLRILMATYGRTTSSKIARPCKSCGVYSSESELFRGQCFRCNLHLRKGFLDDDITIICPFCKEPHETHSCSVVGNYVHYHEYIFVTTGDDYTLRVVENLGVHFHVMSVDVVYSTGHTHKILAEIHGWHDAMGDK